MKKKLFFFIFSFLLFNTVFASDSIICKVSFEFKEVFYKASYRIEEMSYNVFYAVYKPPFSSEYIETSNVRWIHYDREMVQDYFVGSFQKSMADVGEFSAEEVFSIDQYGIDMEENSAKAQILFFYNAAQKLLGKVVLPGFFPLKCI